MSSAPEGGSRNGRMLPMRKLKDLALTDIPKEHPLRDVLLAEKDKMPVAKKVEGGGGEEVGADCRAPDESWQLRGRVWNTPGPCIIAYFVPTTAILPIFPL